MEKDIRELLNKIADEIINKLKSKLTDNDSVASGNLKNDIEKDITGNRLDIKMNYYYKFVNKGTKPHMPPVSAIEKWVRLKGINVSPWAIAMNIKKFGTKKHPFIYILDNLNFENKFIDSAKSLLNNILIKDKKIKLGI